MWIKEHIKRFSLRGWRRRDHAQARPTSLTPRLIWAQARAVFDPRLLSYFVVVTAADVSEPSSLTALLLSFLVVLVASSISDFAFLLSLSSEVNASAVVGPWTSHIGSEVNAIDIVQTNINTNISTSSNDPN